MLRNVEYQIHADEQQQNQIEASMAPLLERRRRASFKALQQHSPQLAETLGRYEVRDYFPLVTRKSGLNITSSSQSRCLYHIDPEEQVTQQLHDFCKQALRVDLKESTLPVQRQASQALTLNRRFAHFKDSYQDPDDDTDALVILGVGLGLHLLPLLTLKAWKRILIIEPNADLLCASLYSAQWKELFGQAKAQGCELAIVAGFAGKENYSQIQTWLSQQAVSSFFVFKHYNYQAFNLLEHKLASKELLFSQLQDIELEEHSESEFECCFSLSHFLFDWADESNIADNEAKKQALQQQSRASLKAFRQLFPDIYQAYQRYQSQRWHIFVQPNGEFNLVDIKQGLSLFQFSAKQESAEYFRHFQDNPNLDPLECKKRTGKPSPYLHFKYGEQLKAYVRELPAHPVAPLPKAIPSFIMYGCGMGYHVEQLLQQHQITHYVLYEPVHDYFYASLALIDWSALLAKCNVSGSTLYFNVGDDGSYMYEDLLNQYKGAGVYILSYTYFFISHFAPGFRDNVKETREKLRVVSNVGEYYDHCFYNLTHTTESFRRACHYQLAEKPESFQQQLKNIPVFLVGNGPSLDDSIETIRANQNKAIIISCGTSLKALYHYGIKPDFHAEVEQTKMTSVWISQVPDLEWVKDINLLTVNGIHPTVLDMFKQSFISLKVGEAATMAYDLCAEEFAQFQQISHSYPTVTNSALSNVLALGFKQIYLFGVDLGAKDPTFQHSKLSAYTRKRGEQVYQNMAENMTDYKVKGNFQDLVHTKHEFKFSAEVLKQTLVEYDNVKCFNCSDGAFIHGSEPLPLNHVVLNQTLDKQGFIQQLAEQAYSKDVVGLVAKFEQNYAKENYDRHYLKVLKLFEQDCHTQNEVLCMLDEHADLMRQAIEDERSLYSFLMYGTSNFMLTYLVRLAFYCKDVNLSLQYFAYAKSLWLEYLREGRDFYMQYFGEFDKTENNIVFDKNAI